MKTWKVTIYLFSRGKRSTFVGHAWAKTAKAAQRAVLRDWSSAAGVGHPVGISACEVQP